MRRLIARAMVLALCAGYAWADGPKLGKPLTAAELAPWDISIMPDGTGLPPGSGNAAQGATIYVQKCITCHGENGKGGISAALVTDRKITSVSAGEKSIANFWPYATTVFDIIRRAMPWNLPRTLSNDEVYALTAYVLAQNKLIDEGAVMNAETLPKVRMPNREGFIVRFPEKTP